MKLQFYKKGISIKYIRRAVYLLVVFVLSLVYFETSMNYEEDKVVSVVGEPTLPTVEVDYLENERVVLNGYITQMDPCYLRDAVIPLSDDRSFNFSINKYKNKIDAVSYELRSLDTQRKIGGREVEGLTDEAGTINGSFQVESLIERGEEYLIVLTVESEERQIRYYTRIMQPTEEAHLRECIDFMKEFHDIALSDNCDELATYMEPDRYANKSTLYEVTINSSMDQLGYGQFDGSQIDPPQVCVSDINDDYTVATLSYQMVRQTGRAYEYYNLKEYFRVRYGRERMYLLDYKRTMEEIPNEKTIKIEENVVDLGISSPDVHYLSNEMGTLVSFVQAGELYQYDQAKRTLSKVFGFIGRNKTDIRGINDQHRIMVLNIDESGSMDYVVYGYMSAGDHEGQNGINLYHYDCVSKESVEQVFIESPKSYQIMNADFSKLLYETADEYFYIMISGTLLEIKLDELKVEEMITGFSDDQYAVSASGRYLAWVDNQSVGEAIHILDLEKEEKYDISAPSGSLLRPLDFMGEDFIYGIVDKNNIRDDGAGNEVYPMHKLIISSIAQGQEEKLMTYSKSNVLVSDVNIDSFTIFLNRVVFDGSGMLVPYERDTIKNSAGEVNKSVSVNVVSDESKGEMVTMTMAALGKKEELGKVAREVSGIVSAQGLRNVAMNPESSQEQFFVYIGGTVEEATDNLIQAIQTADEGMGIVIDNKQRYVWKRGRKSYQNSLKGIAVGSGDVDASSSAKALSAMLVREGENVQVHRLLDQGDSPISIIDRTLDVTALDLTGCSLSQVLYYVSSGTPVYARTGENRAVLIVGYESSSIVCFNPDTGNNMRMSMEEAAETFENNGNVFISFIRK